MKNLFFIFILLFSQSIFSGYRIAIDFTTDWVWSEQVYDTHEEACQGYVGYPWFYNSGILEAKVYDIWCIFRGDNDKHFEIDYKLPVYYEDSVDPPVIVCLFPQIEIVSNGKKSCAYPDLTCLDGEYPVLSDDGKIKHCQISKVCLSNQNPIYDSIGNLYACEEIPIVDKVNKGFLDFTKILSSYKDYDSSVNKEAQEIKEVLSKNKEKNPDLDNIDTSSLDSTIKTNHFDLPEFLTSLFPSSAYCPNDSEFNLLGSNYSFSYSNICYYLSLLSNIVMIFSIYFSYRIIRSS